MSITVTAWTILIGCTILRKEISMNILRKKKYSVIRSEQLRLSRDIVKFTEHERNHLNYSIQLMTDRIKEVEKCVSNPFILKQTCFCQSIATIQGIKKKLWSSLLFISKSR